ncbi:hypothetical protein [Aureimonas sp. ME7]|uniref:hypothetical protein n=1 Tax=Aureimonas sp. ME7 TaxID=2744252 RepID=UPI001FCE5CC8|nr:hypothetical protein [Aureimonas sp. ME7]
MSMDVLAQIGKAQLRVVGLNPQRLATESEARFPGAPAWNGMDYQGTGRGERRFLIEARTLPHVFGGIDALEWLIKHHEALEPVEYLRMGANYAAKRIARVGIRNLFHEETKQHPRDGVGRILSVELDLVDLGDR